MADEQKSRGCRIGHPWNLLADIDIRIVNVGFAENYRSWTFAKGLSEEIFYRIYLAVSGSFRLDHPRGSCVIEPGNLYLIPCDVPLKYEGIEPCTHYWIHFVSDRLKTFPHFNEPVRIPLPDPAPVERKMQTIFRHIRRKTDLKTAVFTRNSILELLIPFLEDLAGKLPEKGTYEDFSELLDYIDANLHRNFPISELNVFSKSNSEEFSAAFRRLFGLPPKQFVSLRRIQKAKYLLLETDLPIKEIAARCGYQDEFFFHRIFKKYTGFPPAWYRRHAVR